MKRLIQLTLSIFILTIGLFGQKPIDFTAKLHDLDGKAIQVTGADGKGIVGADGKVQELTLGDVSVNALEGGLAEDANVAGSVKFQRDELARKIYKHSNVSLSVEDIALIKERIGKLYGSMIIGSAWRLLDPVAGKEPPTPEKK